MRQYLFIVGLLLLAGCSPEPVAPVPVTSAEIRILNGTSLAFSDCTVDPTGKFSGDPAFNFGSIGPGAYSDYHLFNNIYRYSWVRLTMNNKSYALNPIDFVGEIPLNGGKYTYKLTHLTGEDRLHLEFIP